MIHAFHCIERSSDRPIDRLFEIETVRVFFPRFLFTSAQLNLNPIINPNLQIARKRSLTFFVLLNVRIYSIKLRIFKRLWQMICTTFSTCLPSSRKKSETIKSNYRFFYYYCLWMSHENHSKTKQQKTYGSWRFFSVDFSETKQKRHTHSHTHA